MPKQLMIEKADGHCKHIYRDNLLDIIPPTYKNGNDKAILIMNYGLNIYVSPETSIVRLFNFLNYTEEYLWEKF